MGLQITTLIFCEHEEVVFTGGQHHRQHERVLGVHVNQIPIHEHWFGVLWRAQDDLLPLVKCFSVELAV